MEWLNDLLEVDFIAMISGIFIIMSVVIAIVQIVGKFFEIIGRPIGWFKKRQIDHEAIEKNSQAIEELSKRHTQDVNYSIEHDKKIENKLSVFMDEMRTEMKQYANNRIHDREQSLEIQRELTNSIKSLVNANSIKDTQIDSLMVAQREVLADRINAKYKHYISMGGIPEDEYDEFVNLHQAYKGCGGNSSGDAKFEYCINHLAVIPVETKLVIRHDK